MTQLDITRVMLKLSGYNVRFRFSKDEDGACLTIKTPECDYIVSMSGGQYDALEAAIFDVAGEVMITGSWFGNDQ